MSSSAALPFVKHRWHGQLVLAPSSDPTAAITATPLALALSLTCIGGSSLLALPFPAQMQEKLRISLESTASYVKQVISAQLKKVTMVTVDCTGVASGADTPTHNDSDSIFSALNQFYRDKSRALAFDHQREDDKLQRFLFYIIPPNTKAFPPGMMQSVLGCEPPAGRTWGLLLTALDYNQLHRQAIKDGSGALSGSSSSSSSANGHGHASSKPAMQLSTVSANDPRLKLAQPHPAPAPAPEPSPPPTAAAPAAESPDGSGASLYSLLADPAKLQSVLEALRQTTSQDRPQQQSPPPQTLVQPPTPSAQLLASSYPSYSAPPQPTQPMYQPLPPSHGTASVDQYQPHYQPPQSRYSAPAPLPTVTPSLPQSGYQPVTAAQSNYHSHYHQPVQPASNYQQPPLASQPPPSSYQSHYPTQSAQSQPQYQQQEQQSSQYHSTTVPPQPTASSHYHSYSTPAPAPPQPSYQRPTASSYQTSHYQSQPQPPSYSNPSQPLNQYQTTQYSNPPLSQYTNNSSYPVSAPAQSSYNSAVPASYSSSSYQSTYSSSTNSSWQPSPPMVEHRAPLSGMDYGRARPVVAEHRAPLSADSFRPVLFTAVQASPPPVDEPDRRLELDQLERLEREIARQKAQLMTEKQALQSPPQPQLQGQWTHTIVELKKSSDDSVVSERLKELESELAALKHKGRDRSRSPLHRRFDSPPPRRGRNDREYDRDRDNFANKAKDRKRRKFGHDNDDDDDDHTHTHVHTHTHANSDRKAVPCRWFFRSKNGCKLGGRCPFSHDPRNLQSEQAGGFDSPVAGTVPVTKAEHAFAPFQRALEPPMLPSLEAVGGDDVEEGEIAEDEPVKTEPSHSVKTEQ